MLRSIGKQAGESVESVLKKKRKVTVGRICRISRRMFARRDTLTRSSHYSAPGVIRKTTRNSATADGPRDAKCQSKSCQLPHNSAGTSCATNP